MSHASSSLNRRSLSRLDIRGLCRLTLQRFCRPRERRRCRHAKVLIMSVRDVRPERPDTILPTGKDRQTQTFSRPREPRREVRGAPPQPLAVAAGRQVVQQSLVRRPLRQQVRRPIARRRHASQGGSARRGSDLAHGLGTLITRGQSVLQHALVHRTRASRRAGRRRMVQYHSVERDRTRSDKVLHAYRLYHRDATS